MCEHVSRLEAEAADTRQLQDIGVRPSLRRLSQLFQTRHLDLLDLLVMRHFSLELSQCVARDGTTLRRPQRRKPFRCVYASLD
jgi:hypothetical protein